MDTMSDQRLLNRRGFLKGSAVFAAVAGLAVAVPSAASGQEPATPAPSEDKKTEPPKKDEPADKKKSALVDKNGREYRVCDMCGGNMYVQDKMWTCEQCGFSYEV
jgi:hypothetical protein